MNALSIIVYFLSFILIWIGAGLIVSSADTFAKKLRISAFSLSFFVLGMLTSIPEFSVGMTALTENKPDIYVGNLIGGIPIIFFLIIPFLAIFGNGIKLNHQLHARNLLFTFTVTLLPSVVILDRAVTNWEGLLLIVSYLVLFFLIQREKGVFDAQHSNVLHLKEYSYTDILKVLLGVGLVVIASHSIVDNTIYFASALHISPFYISLLLIALGTNLPEFSLAIRSVISGKKDIAFGDYMGSAAANTFLFGLFTLLHNGEVVSVNNFLVTFIILAFGLALFYYFSRSKNDISRTEGIFLLVIYIFYVVIELNP